VERPALASAFPTVKGHPVVVGGCRRERRFNAADAGQFGIMGRPTRGSSSTRKTRASACSPSAKRSTRQRVEPRRGPDSQTLPINFIGNVEGRDLYTGRADVIVCDGFIGNVALKVSEGMVDVIKHMLQESLEATLSRENRVPDWPVPPSRISENGSTIPNTGARRLLGVKEWFIICHAVQTTNAIRNAIRVACESASEHVNDRIAAALVRPQTRDGLATASA